MKVATYYTDTVVSRLQIYMGKKAPVWYFRTRATGRTKIGTYPDLSIDDARRLAAELGRRYDSGEDISDASIRVIGGAPKAKTVGDAHSDLLQEKAGVWRQSTKRTNLIYWREHIEPKFSHRPLTSITKTEIRAWLNGYESLNQRNNLRAFFGQIFNHAIQDDMCSENPAKSLKKYDVVRTKIFLSPDEAKSLEAELKNMEATAAKVILLCLYTGQRITQTKTLRWEMVTKTETGDILLRVPAMATKHKRVVNILLKPEARELILRQEQLFKGKSEWVFPSPTTDGPISKLDKTMKRACERAGIKTVAAGKTRHTFANIIANDPEQGIEALSHYLGHSNVAITQKAYAELTSERSRVIADKGLFQ
ncbi:MAG: integrase family protein [PS1 clade bacterium]|nr:integrase family protein [PS1 clade bacterium]MBL6784642.1 integrase family protein [PS1 clade bacterium]